MRVDPIGVLAFAGVMDPLPKMPPNGPKHWWTTRKLYPPVDFVTFARLREVRKELAKAEQVPAYAIFTNEQLAEIAKALPLSANALSKIEGVGESRVEKYGGQFLKVLKDEAKIRAADAKP